MKKINIKKTIDILNNNVIDFIGKDNILNTLSKNTFLRIKVGIDPTASSIHLGHLVLLKKLRLLQDEGHKILLVIGDFTGLIGDPTDKNSTRPNIDIQEIKKNANIFKKKIFKILNENKTEIFFNSIWLNNINLKNIIKLTSSYTVTKILERKDFKNRLLNKRSLLIHELLYPLIQGYDSIKLKPDLEIGGYDQKLNFIVTRELQKKYNIPLEGIVTYPVLLGLDGKKKMSKSLNNHIDIEDDPNEIFGKIMSISDDMMINYGKLLDFFSNNDIKNINCYFDGYSRKNKKLELAKYIITYLFNKDIAIICENNFVNTFNKKNIILSDNIKKINIFLKSNKINIIKILQEKNIIISYSYGMRLLKQNAISINNNKITSNIINIDFDNKYLIKIGKKRFFLFYFFKI